MDIKVNGSRPWDIQVHDERIYKRVVLGGIAWRLARPIWTAGLMRENMDEMFIAYGGEVWWRRVRSQMFVEKAGRKFQAVHNALTNRQDGRARR